MIERLLKQKVERAIDTVRGSTLDEGCREDILTMLDAAATGANGLSDEDKLQSVSESVLLMSCNAAIQSVRINDLIKTTIHDSVEKAIESHKLACPLHGKKEDPWASRWKQRIDAVKPIIPWVAIVAGLVIITQGGSALLVLVKGLIALF